MLAAAFCTNVSAAEFMFRTGSTAKCWKASRCHWSADQMLLLGRDGQLHEFNPKLAKEGKKTSPRFFGYSQSEVKTVLQKEFDKRFDISTTRHYLVVHPHGERDQWANRFEDLYKRFEHYFRVRGFKLSEPQYPLVAVVFRDQAEYQRHAAAGGTPMQPNTLGHYDPKSNRVFLFDITSGAGGGDWSENADTIIHEATHQTANNVGVHKRFTDVPRWVVEGLATMFEARGVWNAQYDNSQADRINRGRLQEFHDYVATRRRPGALGRADHIRQRLPRRCERRLRRGVGAVVLPVRNSAAAVCRVPGENGGTAAVCRVHACRADGGLSRHLRQRDEDVRDEVLALHGRSEIKYSSRCAKRRPLAEREEHHHKSRLPNSVRCNCNTFLWTKLGFIAT